VGSGASVSVCPGDVGLPWTPPVAALAIVPATTSTTNAMRRILSGFMGTVSAGRPTDHDGPNGHFEQYRPDGLANAIGRTASSGGRRGGRLSARPFTDRVSAGLSQHPDEYRPQHPILLAVNQQLGEPMNDGEGPSPRHGSGALG
jgi:hypothetical protein